MRDLTAEMLECHNFFMVALCGKAFAYAWNQNKKSRKQKWQRSVNRMMRKQVEMRPTWLGMVNRFDLDLAPMEVDEKIFPKLENVVHTTWRIIRGKRQRKRLVRTSFFGRQQVLNPPLWLDLNVQSTRGTWKIATKEQLGWYKRLSWVGRDDEPVEKTVRDRSNQSSCPRLAVCDHHACFLTTSQRSFTVRFELSVFKPTHTVCNTSSVVQWCCWWWCVSSFDGFWRDAGGWIGNTGKVKWRQGHLFEIALYFVAV